MGNLLVVRDLKVNFHLDDRVITAVDGVNLDIADNEVLVLAGESGSGKTISALSVTRLLPSTARITSGSVIFQDKDLLKLDEASLRNIRGSEIAYMFQEPAAFLNPVYTIGDQIIEAIMLHQAKPKKEARQEAIELLNLVKIQEPERVIHDYPHQLSGGMNQRAFIAMALACKPKLLIADEPTTSLDVTIEAQILELLIDLKNRLGFSLLFITHNLSIARRIADRVLVMYKGKIVENAGAQVIFNSPKHIHTKELILAYQKIGKI